MTQKNKSGKWTTLRVIHSPIPTQSTSVPILATDIQMNAPWEMWGSVSCPRSHGHVGLGKAGIKQPSKRLVDDRSTS